MNLRFDASLAESYSSNSQKIRALSEHWVDTESYCPNCGNTIVRYANNKPVADFYCDNCREDYELKSKSSNLGKRAVDGAYRTMIERLQSSSNPNFFLLSYNPSKYTVTDFLVIPKHFFVPEVIERRKPLAPTARRAGWIGCNINLQGIPESGKIFFIRTGQQQPKIKVLGKWQKTLFLRSEKDLSAKGWMVDVMNCVERLGKRSFSLADVYAFESELSKKHPDNRYVKDKIRQQLQVLRDKSYLEFTARGQYRLT
jgi:type II restriction enzyme